MIYNAIIVIAYLESFLGLCLFRLYIHYIVAVFFPHRNKKKLTPIISKTNPKEHFKK